jgi:acyl-CoA thioesterase-1
VYHGEVIALCVAVLSVMAGLANPGTQNPGPQNPGTQNANPEPGTRNPEPARPRIVAFGDSLTSGYGIGESRAYPAILQKRIEDAGFEYEVVNAGVSGDTSSRALPRLERSLEGNVRILIVALGANDGLRGTSIDTVKANLARIIETAQSRGIQVLLCGMEALPIARQGGLSYSVGFHNLFGELAARYDVPLVPFMMFNVIGNPKLMQPDRVHPNADGARAIAENIWPHLQTLLASVVH